MLASRCLSNDNSKFMLTVGGGALEAHLIRAHLTARHTNCVVCEDWSSFAVGDAYIVSCATHSEMSLVLGKCLNVECWGVFGFGWVIKAVDEGV